MAGARDQERGIGGTGTRGAAWLAWSLVCLTLAMSAASGALFVLARFVDVPGSSDAPGGGTAASAAVLLLFVSYLAFPVVGALIVSRRPRNPIGWICLADGLLWALINMIQYYSTYGLAAPGSVPFPVGIFALTAWGWVPAVGLLGTYLLLLFPDGRLPNRKWRPLAWLCGAQMVSLSVVIFLTPGPLLGLGGARNPFGLEGLPWLAAAQFVLIPLLPACMLASALSLVLRYRRSGGVERQQIKWIAFAASFFGLVYLSFVARSLVLPEDVNPDLWQYVVILSSAGVPVAIGFAVLRYRLYDIDVIVNRALVYGSLTATLALVYFGGVTTTQAVFRALTGQQEQPQLAVVVSTLAIAALFSSLRRRVQSFIDQRFYRRKYDAVKTLEAFSNRLRDETNLDALSVDLVGVVRETMQPARVSLWLRPDTLPKSEQAD
jgi:hypothetical protein